PNSKKFYDDLARYVKRRARGKDVTSKDIGKSVDDTLVKEALKLKPPPVDEDIETVPIDESRNSSVNGSRFSFKFRFLFFLTLIILSGIGFTFLSVFVLQQQANTRATATAAIIFNAQQTVFAQATNNAQETTIAQSIIDAQATIDTRQTADTQATINTILTLDAIATDNAQATATRNTQLTEIANFQATATVNAQSTVTANAQLTLESSPIIVFNPGDQVSMQDSFVNLQIQLMNTYNSEFIFGDFETLPNGLSIDSDTGLISGILDTALGSYEVSIVVRNHDSRIQEVINFTWNIIESLPELPVILNTDDYLYFNVDNSASQFFIGSNICSSNIQREVLYVHAQQITPENLIRNYRYVLRPNGQNAIELVYSDSDGNVGVIDSTTPFLYYDSTQFMLSPLHPEDLPRNHRFYVIRNQGIDGSNCLKLMRLNAQHQATGYWRLCIAFGAPPNLGQDNNEYQRCASTTSDL
ncbi:MAG: putative Ig domain-containing protein, partial [Bacteroidota bacterium]